VLSAISATNFYSFGNSIASTADHHFRVNTNDLFRDIGIVPSRFLF